MALVVQKYGGTSVGSIEKIMNVARRVGKTKDAGNDVIVVVSAMAGETDRLVGLVNSITDLPNEREYDQVVASGEQVSIGLLAIALESLGYRAKSFLGFQVPIYTDSAHARARIRQIETENVMRAINEGYIAVIAGFQGIDEFGDITTLGRGGSDTSAVAIAAAMKADVCEIYTDVDGVYTTDPNICPNARKLEKISYDEMLEMASLGAKVLQIRSVEFAKKYGVRIHVRSSMNEKEGTIVTGEDEIMETAVVSGVTYNKNEAKITIVKVPDRPGIAAKIFKPIADAGINVDMIVQNVSLEGFTDLTFTVPKTDYKKTMLLIEKVAQEIGAERVQGDDKIAKVSIVGVGMRSHPGVAAKMFRTLASENINILMISTSEIKVSCVIEEKYTELAVRVLHDAFELGGEPKEEV
ncbi:MAG: aspartate kinase [Deltaproteobacteria bacterium]|nr:MAG: aspartate kinase [Deltaproteobacteria bacterium]